MYIAYCLKIPQWSSLPKYALMLYFFRAEEFLGLVDIRKKMIKNPSEKMKDN